MISQYFKESLRTIRSGNRRIRAGKNKGAGTFSKPKASVRFTAGRTRASRRYRMRDNVRATVALKSKCSTRRAVLLRRSPTRIAAVGLKKVKVDNSIIYMLSVACAGLTLNACEATGPDAASAPPPNSGQAGIYRVPTSGADLERLPNPGMLMTRSSTTSVH